MTECPHPNKKAYATSREARRATPPETLTPYLCRCGWWHLTKKEQADQRLAAKLSAVLQK